MGVASSSAYSSRRRRKRLLPGAIRGLAQHVALKNGFAVIGDARTDRNSDQHRIKFRQHHGPADVCPSRCELEAERLQRW